MQQGFGSKGLRGSLSEAYQLPGHHWGVGMRAFLGLVFVLLSAGAQADCNTSIKQADVVALSTEVDGAVSDLLSLGNGYAKSAQQFVPDGDGSNELKNYLRTNQAQIQAMGNILIINKLLMDVKVLKERIDSIAILSTIRDGMETDKDRRYLLASIQMSFSLVNQVNSRAKSFAIENSAIADSATSQEFMRMTPLFDKIGSMSSGCTM